MKVRINDSRNIPDKICFRDLCIGDYFLNTREELCVKLHEDGPDTDFYNAYNYELESVFDMEDESLVRMVLVEINIIKEV